MVNGFFAHHTALITFYVLVARRKKIYIYIVVDSKDTITNNEKNKKKIKKMEIVNKRPNKHLWVQILKARTLVWNKWGCSQTIISRFLLQQALSIRILIREIIWPCFSKTTREFVFTPEKMLLKRITWVLFPFLLNRCDPYEHVLLGMITTHTPLFERNKTRPKLPWRNTLEFGWNAIFSQ